MKDVRQNFEFFFTSSSPHLVRKFMQPPLLRLKVAYCMSAFEGTPSPLSADVINGSPLTERSS